MNRLLLLMIGIGCVLLYSAFQEQRLNSGAKAEAQELSCAALCTNGPGENTHVRMTDFLLCDFAYVTKTKTKRGRTRWVSSWIPAVPLGGEYHRTLQTFLNDTLATAGNIPHPTDIRVLIKDTQSESAEDVSRLAAQDNLQGMIINDVSSLSSGEKNLLQESYPGIDFDKCWILQPGRTPTSGGGVIGQFAGGFGLIGLAGFLFYRRRNKAKEESAEEPVIDDSDRVIRDDDVRRDEDKSAGEKPRA